MTALSLVFPVQNLINAVMIGFGIGINAVISFYLGAADQKKADQAASQGMLLGTFHGILLMIICLVVIHPFLSLFTNDAEIVNLGLRYSKIVFLFSVFFAWELVFEKVFQAVGKMNISMICLMSGCLVNIFLDPVLIFGLGPFPSLGIEGAALATGLGQTFSAILYLIFYMVAPISVKFRRAYFKPDFALCKKNVFHRDSCKSEHGSSIPAHFIIKCNPCRLWSVLCLCAWSLLQITDIPLSSC